MKQFVPNTLGLKVETIDGFKSFAGIAYMGDSPIYRLTFENKAHLDCSIGHRLLTSDGFLAVSDIHAGNHVITNAGLYTKVISIAHTGKTEPVYDLVDVEGHTYFTNGLTSHNCEFVSGDETLINSLVLSRLRASDPQFYVSTTRWYHEPEPNHAFLVALDPSCGTLHDYAAIEVFQLPEMIQVAEWQANDLAARHQVRVLMDILYVLDDSLRNNPAQQGNPEIYWTFENNAIGESILTIVEDTDEDRFPGMLVTERRRKGLQMRRVRRGLHTTQRNKLSACSRLKSLLESGRMKIASNNLIKELKNFVATGSTVKAKLGEHDDLVLATLLAIRMLDIVLSWGTNAGDLREIIGGDESEGETDPMPVVFSDEFPAAPGCFSIGY